MKKAIAIVLAAISISAMCAPVRSMVAARSTVIAASEQKQYTAADYIQDGLIAMWDGIENDGYGIHNPDKIGWQDLSGNNFNLNRVNSAYTQIWEDDCLVLDGLARGNGVLSRSSSDFASSVRTIECICSANASGSVQGILNLGNGAKSGVGVSSDGYIACKDVSSMSLFATTAYAAWTFDGNLANVNPNYIYVNGQSSDAISKSMGVSSMYLGKTMVIGQLYQSSFKYIGKIHRIALYSRQLSSTEIQHNYRIDKVRFNLP